MLNPEGPNLPPEASLSPSPLGTSDPCCIVKWGGVEIGRTDIIRGSCNPRWRKAVFSLPLNLPPSNGVEDEDEEQEEESGSDDEESVDGGSTIASSRSAQSGASATTT